MWLVQPSVILLVILAAFGKHVDCQPLNDIDSQSKEKLISHFKQHISNGHAKKVLEDGSTTCLICEYLVGELMYQLESNTTKTEFLPAIEEKICSLLFPTSSVVDPLIKKSNFLKISQCEEVADILLKAILKTLDSDVQPTEVCEKLTVCKL